MRQGMAVSEKKWQKDKRSESIFKRCRADAAESKGTLCLASSSDVCPRASLVLHSTRPFPEKEGSFDLWQLADRFTNIKFALRGRAGGGSCRYAKGVGLVVNFMCMLHFVT